MWNEAFDTILQGDFLLGLFQILMATLISIVNLILYPFSFIIESMLPDLNNGLLVISEYFNYAGQYMAWLLNLFAVPAMAITLIVGYYVFVFGTTFTVWTVKLVVKWKQAIWG